MDEMEYTDCVTTAVDFGTAKPGPADKAHDESEVCENLAKILSHGIAYFDLMPG